MCKYLCVLAYELLLTIMAIVCLVMMLVAIFQRRRATWQLKASISILGLGLLIEYIMQHHLHLAVSYLVVTVVWGIMAAADWAEARKIHRGPP